MPPNRSSVANILYAVINTVEIGGVTFSIYGSVLRTIDGVKKHDYADLYQAYVALTGDVRKDASVLQGVAVEDVETVVCGEMQIRWATFTGRENLLPALQKNHEARVALALSRTQEDVQLKKKTKTKGARKMSEENQDTGATENAEGATEAGTTATTDGSGETTGKKAKNFSRGLTGAVAKMLDEGVTEIETLTEKMNEAFPAVKNVRRHIQYVAREKGVKLTNRL